jgi:beta-galactosidase
VTARAEGLRTGSTTVRTTPARSRATTAATAFEPDYPAAPNYPYADASYSGRPDTLPAAMLDGDAATGWSNAFYKSATALLPAFSAARPEDWVSVTWARPRTVDRVEVSFTVDATHTLPVSVEVSVWDGKRYVPVTGAAVDWATASDTPTVITFHAIRGSRLRLVLTSGHPGAADGAVRISRLEAPAG